jgi:glycosyltransferase involved in cell wall biosynthesis
MGDQPRVIHVVESFGGGVASAILDYVRNTPEYDHGLVYAPRGSAPQAPDALRPFVFALQFPEGHLRRIRFLRAILQANPRAIVHAHSSYGGLYARLSVSKNAVGGILYTPHCYSFERRDVGSVTRLGFKLAEQALAPNTTAFLACSPREAALSQWRLSRADIEFVPNVGSTVGARTRAARVSAVAMATVGRSSGRPADAATAQSKSKPGNLVLAAVGRLGAQKDPQFFIDVVAALRRAGAAITPRWIGGGDPSWSSRLRSADIDVTGWLERDEAVAALSTADVYVHTAGWEGFPVALLEASALGLPTVVRDIPAFDGLDLPQRIVEAEDVVDAWPTLETPAERKRNALSTRSALDGYTDMNQRRTLRATYGRFSKVVGAPG